MDKMNPHRDPGFHSDYLPGHILMLTNGNVVQITGVRFFEKNFPVYYVADARGYHFQIHSSEIMGHAIETDTPLFGDAFPSAADIAAANASASGGVAKDARPTINS